MASRRRLRLHELSSHPILHSALLVTVILLIGNLGALVDLVYHPEIPYFDHEHVLTGVVAVTVTALLFGAMIGYLRHLQQALTTIQSLERILPICANCKKMRKPNSDPAAAESWQPLEQYFEERTTSEFSHGLCPSCVALLYPDLESGPVTR